MMHEIEIMEEVVIVIGNYKVWVMTGTEWLRTGQDKFIVV